MLRDFNVFLRALWNEWRILLTGGTIIALLAVWTFAGGKPVPQTVNWCILGVTLVISAFLAWRKEWIKAERGFVNIDFESLQPIFEGRTDPQRKRLLRHNIGQRIKMIGELQDIRESTGPSLFPTEVSIRNNKLLVHVEVFPWDLSFRGVALLERGTILTVTGRIKTILSSSQIILSSCELLRADPGTIKESPP